MNYIYNYNSPLGEITLSSNGDALTGLWFCDQKYCTENITNDYTYRQLPVFKQTVKWLDIYFSGVCPDFTPKIHVSGTDFRECVWNILLKIPYGKTMTYKEIADITAEKLGYRKMSAQAVGGAVGHNPISIIVPCHRVVGSSGSLTGYAGGLDKKIYLLKLEGTDMKKLFIPKNISHI